MDYFAKEFLDQLAIGNVIVENTKEFDTRESFAIDVESKSLDQKFVAREWDTLNLPLQSLIFGISKEFRREWD